MKRIDRVLDYVRKVSRHSPGGVTAEEVAVALSLIRSNTTTALNTLWKEGVLEKVGGRPVRYRPTNKAAEALAPLAAPNPLAGLSHDVLPDDPFRAMVGWNESLAAAVKQAKAAVLYPGGGLHTLVSGPTGVGKSRLAELMFQFGTRSGVFRQGARLITFNCADYSNNPQLLMAHLFGVAKGAYTGADKNQVGLVEHADGGLLFLDEVHRLAPEGQEMLFRLIDKGYFRRLGETETERTSQTLIVCATTERIDSSLLRTFTRRIPMVINLPSLDERTLRERLKFLKYAFRAEARKMGASLVIPRGALEHLLLYDCPGNVGQLTSDVMLSCAQAFLRYLNDHRVPIPIGLDLLPDHVRRQVVGIRQRRGELEEVLAAHPAGLEVELGDKAAPDEPEARLSNIYEMMERETRALEGKSFSVAAIQRHLSATVEAHFRHFLNTVQRRYEAGRQELTAVIDVSVLAAVEQAIAYAEGHLRRVMPKRILFGLALHVQAALDRLRLSTSVTYPPLEHIQTEHPLEYEAAVTMVRMLTQQLQVSLPEGEVAYAALFLTTADDAGDDRRIALAVACHGQGVASGMTDVAEYLAGRVNVFSLDMPLDGSPDDVLQQLTAWVKQGSFSGVLLLVDMGSLSFLADRLHHATGIPIRVVPMASTILLIEAIQHAQLPGVTLDQVYDAVAEAQRRLAASPWSGGNRTPVVITCCFTGQGNAELLQKVVQRAMRARGHSVAVVAASIPAAGDWERMFTSLLQGDRPLAVVGPIHPGIADVFYVSNVEIFTPDGQDRLAALVERHARLSGPEVLTELHPPAEELARTLATGVENDFHFTNPHTLMPEAVRAADALAEEFGVELPSGIRTGLVFHIACLVERRAGERGQRPVPGPDPELEPLARWLAPLSHRFAVHFLPDDLRLIREILQGHAKH